MRYYLILIFISTTCFGNIFGQNILWKDFWSNPSFSHFITETKDGKILVIGDSPDNSGRIANTFAFYNSDGTLITKNIFPSKFKYNYFRYYFPKSKGGFLLFDYDGLAVEVNENFNIMNEIFNFNGTIKHIQKVDNWYIIYVLKKENLKYYTSKFIFDLNFELLRMDTTFVNQNYANIFFNDSGEFLQSTISLGKLKFIKYDSLYHKIWEIQSNIEGTEYSNYYLKENKDIIIVNLRKLEYTSTNTKLQNLNIICISNEGILKWAKILKPLNVVEQFENYVQIKNMIELEDNSLLFCGSDGFAVYGPVSNIMLLKLDSNGNEIWKYESSLCSEGDEIEDIILGLDKKIYATGTACNSDYTQPQRAFILKLSNPLTSTSFVDKKTSFKIKFDPNLNMIDIDYNVLIDYGRNASIYNTQGQLIQQINLSINQMKYSVTNLLNGIYILAMPKTSGGIEYMQFVKF